MRPDSKDSTDHHHISKYIQPCFLGSNRYKPLLLKRKDARLMFLVSLVLSVRPRTLQCSRLRVVCVRGGGGGSKASQGLVGGVWGRRYR